MTETETFDIEINDLALNESGFTKFSLPLNGNSSSGSNTTMMTLWHEDSAKIIYCHFYKSDLDRSVKSLEDKLLSSDELIDDNTARSLVTYFRNECIILKQDKGSGFFNGNGSNGKSKKSKSSNKQQQGEQQQQQWKQQQQQPEPPKRQFPAYKYSNKGKGPLYEAIILAGRPVFLKYVNGSIEKYDAIEEDIRIIKPLHAEHYPYDPVEFENMNEVARYYEVALNYNIDMLYLEAKKIAGDYNDQSKDKINLLAIEIISSYFQDRFPTTHYDIVLGGKNDNLRKNA